MTQPPADAPTRILVRDLVVVGLIGVYEHEKSKPQRIRVNLDLEVAGPPPARDSIREVVSYEDIVVAIRQMVAQHLHLIETLAERIAARCLEDARVAKVTVRVEKLDVFADCGSVGVEIVRGR
jgi:dihydroneopterin aldolase